MEIPTIDSQQQIEIIKVHSMCILPGVYIYVYFKKYLDVIIYFIPKLDLKFKVIFFLQNSN